MKTIIVTLLVILSLCASAQGQTFNNGSTGADGAFHPPFSPLPFGTQLLGNCTPISGPADCTVVVPLREPPNHIFNFTTVTIDAGYTVKFKPNAANTPVFILAQGDAAQGTGVIINGTIDISGEQGMLTSSLTVARGGPGGFSGGMGVVAGAPTSIGGAGNGPGGGGSFSRDATFSYGTPELQPLIGGSGGAGSDSTVVKNGGGGGGALLIASSGVIDVGSGSSVAIAARGGGGGAAGSGGAIRLVATVLRGSRSLQAVLQGGLAPGRIRFEAAQANQYTGTTSPPYTFNPPGQPIMIFPPITPTLRIVSIGGVPLPAQPTAEANTPDITLPAPLIVPIELEATHVPSGTLARVFVRPQFGAGGEIIPRPVVALTGPVGQPKRGTITVTLPASGVGIISAVIDSVVPEP